MVQTAKAKPAFRSAGKSMLNLKSDLNDLRQRSSCARDATENDNAGRNREDLKPRGLVARLLMVASLVAVTKASQGNALHSEELQEAVKMADALKDNARHLIGATFDADPDVGLDFSKTESSSSTDKKLESNSLATLIGNPTLGTDFTGVQPTIVKNQAITFYKATGQGSTVWYALNIKGTHFAILEVNGQYPARIVNPNGVIVDVHSDKEGDYPQHKNIWATVTTRDGGYFLIPTTLWNTLKQAKPSDSQFSLPVSSGTARTIIINRVAFGEALKNRIVIVPESSIVLDFFAMLSSEGTVLRDSILSSARGYLKVEFQSYTSKGQTDTYRVCAYCLAHDAKNGPKGLLEDTGFKADVNLQEELSLERIEEVFWEKQHSSKRLVFIPDVQRSVQSLLVPLFEGKFYSLTDAHLNKIVDLCEQGKLDKGTWIKELSLAESEEETKVAPLLILNDRIFELNLNAARDLFNSRPEGEFDDLKESESELDLHRLVIDEENLENWFEEGSQLPGLFIRDTSKEAHESWPVVSKVEDGVRSLYYLNARLVKIILGVEDGELTHPDSESLAHFVKTRQENVHFLTQDTPRSEQTIPEARSWIQVSHKERLRFISQANIKHLYSLGIENLFVQKRLLSQVEEGHLVRIGKDAMVLNLGLMKELAGLKSAQPEQVTNTLRHMLGEETKSTQGIQRTIQYSLQSYFTGICNGNFVNESICQGTFKGDYHHCKDPKAKYPCAEIKTPFVCKGKFVRKGCYGDLTLKVKVNHTDYDLITKDFSPLALDQCGLDSTLTRTTPTSETTIKCSKNYHIQAQKCIGASVSKNEKLPDGKTKVRTKINCAESLDLTTLECTASLMSTFQCHEPLKQKNEKICGDDFVHRTCSSGGDFKGCYIYNPKDEEVICQGGVYDGKTCTANKFYIEVDDNHYFISSTCSGKYVKGVSCQGKFSGQILSCEDRDPTDKGICDESAAVGPISCDGTLTKTGCEGDYHGSIVVNGNMNFSVEAVKTKTDFENFNEGTVRLNFLDYVTDQTDQDKNWRDMSVECKGGFTAKTQCKDAIFSGRYRAADGWNLHSVRCHEVFDLSTYQCLSGSAEATHCRTEDDEATELTSCQGTFTKSTCGQGSSLDGCKEDDRDAVVVECKQAHWDGVKCLDKELIIPVTEKRYITGFCSGDYESNTSCDGDFKGGYVNCPISDLTEDTTCTRETVDDFTCHGKVDKFGCHGSYNGYVHARGDLIKVTSDKGAWASSLGVVSQRDVTLRFIQNIVPVRSRVKLGVDRDLSGVCQGSFNAVTKDCQMAELNIVNDYTPNATYTRLTCHGTLNLDTLNCTDGLLSLYSCNGSQTFPDNNRCLGIYHHLDCKEGGNATSCFKKDSKDINVYCDGAYKDGHCSPFVVPQLGIIMINSSYYIKGQCSSRINDNECQGIFTGIAVVNCTNSSALTVKQVFDHCKPIANEIFGTCTGTMNKKGCKGEYKVAVDINGSTWDFTSEEASTFDTVLVKGKSKLVKRNRGADDKTYVALSCQETFNMKSLSCSKTILQFIDKSYASKGPGIAQTISIVCVNSQFDIKQLSCLSGEYLYYDCVGKSHKSLDKNEGITFTCLGDLKFSKCAAGGQQNKCLNSGPNDVTKECKNSFFDGKQCLSEKEPENTEIKITSLGSVKDVDTDGQEVTIERFTVEKFHMFGATAKALELGENVIDKIVLLNGKHKEDGSISDIEMDQNPAKLSLDEGALHKITFDGFSLDELPYRDFAINDDAQFIRILFKNMIIHQFMLTSMTSEGSVIRRLVVNDKTTLRDYGVDNLAISLGYGIIQMRDVELYLPYIKNSTMDQWIGDEKNKIDATLSVPTVEDISISPFKLILQKEKKKIYLEFPELTIKERSLDIIKLDDYLLGSTSFTSNPVAAETVIRNYEQYLREHPGEQGLAAEFSSGVAEEAVKPKDGKDQHRDGSTKTDSTHESSASNKSSDHHGIQASLSVEANH
jgi:hypothetical protein